MRDGEISPNDFYLRGIGTVKKNVKKNVVARRKGKPHPDKLANGQGKRRRNMKLVDGANQKRGIKFKADVDKWCKEV